MESVRKVLEDLRGAGMLRALRGGDVCGAKINLDSKEFLNFASNDYLGFSSRTDLQKEFLESALKSGKFLMGSCSSRLLGGDNSSFAELEGFFETAYNAEISEEKKRLKCLAFNCGYHANNGILPAVFGSEDLVVCDRLVHASILDGLKLGDFKWRRFPHNDMCALEEILSESSGKYGRICIVTESVFSMDGDRADLPKLAELKNKYNACLYVDEAHALGVFGTRGLGLCSECKILESVDILMGTLGKASASCGAFAMCSADLRSLLINRCRPFIFTTANPPVNQLWSRFVFEKIMSADGLRSKLKKLSLLFRKSVEAQTLGDTQIVPVVLGDVKIAAKVSSALERNGIFAPIVRPPTVPKNSSRIRFSLNADMSEGDILKTAECLNRAISETLGK